MSANAIATIKTARTRLLKIRGWNGRSYCGLLDETSLMTGYKTEGSNRHG